MSMDSILVELEIIREAVEIIGNHQRDSLVIREQSQLILAAVDRIEKGRK